MRHLVAPAAILLAGSLFSAPAQARDIVALNIGVSAKNMTNTRCYTGGASVHPSSGTSEQTLAGLHNIGVSLKYRSEAMVN